VRPRPGPDGVDAVQVRVADLSQGPQRGGVGGDRPEHLRLGPQRLDVDDVDPTRGDRTRHVGQHPAPVMHRHEPRPGQHRRDAVGETGAICEDPQAHHPDHAHYPRAVGGDPQILRPSGKLTHLGGASSQAKMTDVAITIFPCVAGTSVF
jgi:hypothetical protein